MRENDAIETVLQGLRETQPGPGLEARILQRLQAEEHRPHTAWQALHIPRFVMATAATLLLVLAGGWLLHHGHQATQATDTPPQPRQRPAFSTGIATAPATVPRMQRHSTRKAATHAAEQRAGEQVSIPEPPMPLTEQERLLLNLRHRDDPMQLAQLTATAREARYRHEEEQVREFFAPPPPLIGQPYYDQTSPGGTE